MKLATSMALVLVLFVGCATNPRTEWATARESLTATENALVMGNSSGLIKDRDLVTLEPFVKAVRAALDEADKELTASNNAQTERATYYLHLASVTAQKLKEFNAVR